MMHTKRSFFYKLLLSATIFLGIVHRAAPFSQSPQWHTLYSFTTLSNACVMFILLFAAFRYKALPATVSVRFAQLNYVCVVLILVTGLVYHFVLLPEKIAENPAYNVFALGNVIAHYIAPVGMLLDWLLFAQKGLVGKRVPLLCVAVPVVYFAAASLYGLFGAAIPGKNTAYIYFFMDVETLGVAGVAKWASAMLICIFCLAYLIYALDRILAQRANNNGEIR